MKRKYKTTNEPYLTKTISQMTVKGTILLLNVKRI